MKNMTMKALCLSVLCTVGLTQVYAAETSKAELNKQVNVCKKKAQGDQVSYTHGGILFNGTCQPDENGKLIFTVPQPVSEDTSPTPPSDTTGQTAIGSSTTSSIGTPPPPAIEPTVSLPQSSDAPITPQTPNDSEPMDQAVQ